MHAAAPTFIYVLCLLTSAVCAWLLVRSWLRSRTTLLLWVACCFVLLALNNLLLVADLLVFPEAIDLAVPRQLATVTALGVLLVGFIRETEG
jgi:hypothetical protein